MEFIEKFLSEYWQYVTLVIGAGFVIFGFICNKIKLPKNTFVERVEPLKPFIYRGFSWLTLCGCQARNKKIYKKISPTRVSVGSEPI